MKTSVISWDELSTDTDHIDFDVNPDLVIYFGDDNMLKTTRQQLQLAATNAILSELAGGGNA